MFHQNYFLLNKILGNIRLIYCVFSCKLAKNNNKKSLAQFFIKNKST
jgi:hypothetical protein